MNRMSFYFEPGRFFCVFHYFSRRTLLLSFATPLLWLVLFYLLVVGVRLSLGRWPAFGEVPPGWLLPFLYNAVMWMLLPQVICVYAACAIAIVCLFLPKLRPLLIYASAYAVT